MLFAINLVAKNWMAKMLKMNAHLMRPAAVQFTFNETYLVGRTQDAIFRFRFASTPPRDRHLLSMDGMTSDVFFNRSHIFA